MCRAIDSAYEVDEVKDIHDKAQALELYERLAKNIEAEGRCYQIRWRAARKAGELLKAMDKAKGAAEAGTKKFYRVTKNPRRARHFKQQSSDWRKLAAVPKDEFETALADGTICKLTAGKVVPVSHEALLFIGSMRDFERRGYLAKAAADFMATMTDDMLEEVHRIAPLAAAWLATIKEPDNG
jgi:hypothetical protein